MPTQTLRDIERDSIRAFLVQASKYLQGDVLDYGCGKQPYRDIVAQAGGRYIGYDRRDLPANVSGKDLGDDWPLGQNWDAIVCTQVIQYVPRPSTLLQPFHLALRGREGHLLLTYPTCWPEVEREDLHRYTHAGMEHLLAEHGFRVISHVARADIQAGGELFTIGYGVVALAT